MQEYPAAAAHLWVRRNGNYVAQHRRVKRPSVGHHGSAVIFTIRFDELAESIGELRSCIVGELAYEFDSSFRIRIQRGWPMRFRQKHAASEQRVDRPAHRPLSSKKRWLGIQLSFPWQRFVNAGGAERKIREHRPGRPLR
jgi:hypothetical protein